MVLAFVLAWTSTADAGVDDYCWFPGLKCVPVSGYEGDLDYGNSSIYADTDAFAQCPIDRLNHEQWGKRLTDVYVDVYDYADGQCYANVFAFAYYSSSYYSSGSTSCSSAGGAGYETIHFSDLGDVEDYADWPYYLVVQVYLEAGDSVVGYRSYYDYPSE